MEDNALTTNTTSSTVNSNNLLRRITIIGSGWLGLPLAQHLKKTGYQLTITCRTRPKQQSLIQQGFETLLFDSQYISDTFRLSDCDCLLITLPPRLKECDYAEQLQTLLTLAEQSQIPRVLFISSSSVYGDNQGDVDETQQPSPNSPAAKIMWEFEQKLLSHHSINASVLRLSGLFGPGRHPGRFLAGKTDVAQPDAPVNLIHQHDCIGIISAILEQGAWGQAINGCAPHHPSRRHFYTEAARQLELTPPQFVESGGEQGKIINSRVVGHSLAYQFRFPDPLTAI